MTTTLQAALDYIRKGFAVYRVYNTRNGVCTCHKGADCANPGKHPAEPHGVYGATKDPAVIKERFSKRSDWNIGIATGEISGVVVVDLDPRHGSDETLLRLEKERKLFPRTLTEETGGGGQHLYYQYDPRCAGGFSSPGNGIEVLKFGRGATCAPSIHKSGKQYRMIDPDEPIAALPEWLFDHVCRNTDPDTKPLIKRFGQRSIADMRDNGFDQGDRHDGFLYLAGRLYHGGYDEAAAIGIATICAYSCKPVGEVEDAVGRVKEQFRKGGEKNQNWGLPKDQRKKVGRPNELAHTIEAVCARLEPFLIYNEFTGRLVWKSEQRPWQTLGHQWGDPDIVALAAELNVSVTQVTDAMKRFMVLHRHHPVRDYLNALHWDGVARLDRTFPTYFGAEDSPYTQQAGRKFLISAVARQLLAGCQADYTPVLDGPQGIGKSKGIRALCPNPEWFCDNLGDITNEHRVGHRMQGKWIIEIAELAAFRRTDVESLKNFMTHQEDHYRIPYDKHDYPRARQCIFFGTVNPNNDGSYLVDKTGNRRFWPIASSSVDVEAIKRDRDQLWAEAVVAFRNGESWWFTDETVLAHAQIEQESRLSEDPWLEPIAEKISQLITGQGELKVTAYEVCTDWLDIEVRDLTPNYKARAVDCLRVLKFVKDKRKIINGQKQRMWVLSRDEIERWNHEPSENWDSRAMKDNVVAMKQR